MVHASPGAFVHLDFLPLLLLSESWPAVYCCMPLRTYSGVWNGSLQSCGLVRSSSGPAEALPLSALTFCGAECVCVCGMIAVRTKSQYDATCQMHPAFCTLLFVWSW